MYENLGIFRTADAMARHAGARAALVATNIANADTPGYRARALPAFSELAADDGPALALRQTRPGHLSPADGQVTARARQMPGEAAPNGNSVSIEEQMVAAVDARREHSRALRIYRHAMGVIRTSLGR